MEGGKNDIRLTKTSNYERDEVPRLGSKHLIQVKSRRAYKERNESDRCRERGVVAV